METKYYKKGNPTVFFTAVQQNGVSGSWIIVFTIDEPFKWFYIIFVQP